MSSLWNYFTGSSDQAESNAESNTPPLEQKESGKEAPKSESFEQVSPTSSANENAFSFGLSTKELREWHKHVPKPSDEDLQARQKTVRALHKKKGPSLSEMIKEEQTSGVVHNTSLLDSRKFELQQKEEEAQRFAAAQNQARLKQLEEETLQEQEKVRNWAQSQREQEDSKIVRQLGVSQDCWSNDKSNE